MPTTRTCQQCGAMFVPKRERRDCRYCSRNCKDRSAKDRAIAERAAQKVGRACQNCGAGIASLRGNAKWCSEACSAKRSNRKSVARRAMLKAKFGITEAEYDAMVTHQRGRCAICATDDPRGRNWAVDHDHLSGQVRGLLCSRCNTGIGQLQDDPEIIERAAAYVRQHRQLALAV